MAPDSESLIPDPDLLPLPGDTAAAELGFQNWTEAAGRTDDPAVASFAEYTAEDPAVRRLLLAIFGNSPFLTQCFIRDPAFSRGLIETGPRETLERILATTADTAVPAATTDDLMAALRRARREVALTTAIADIAGIWPLEQVTGTLSRFADTALSIAVAHLLYTGHTSGEIELPSPEQPERDSGFFVLGMGKLGAKELNYSSDIDLILLFDHERVRYRGSRSVQQFFVRLARSLVRILEERTRDGYVFRTDLRLRPDPGSTPPVIATIAAETYYESTGQNWERAAMIKARPVAGDLESGNDFLRYLRPFVWRRNLDFAAIQDIHSIKRQINAHRGGEKIAVAGHNVKLGRGGIREIEFFVQTQQLIWGGRDPSLRGSGTCEVLRSLAAAGHIEPEVPGQLEGAYRFLRTVEHRLQMIDDHQTHEVPDDPEKLDIFAKFMGFADTAAFANALSERLHLVEDHYAALFEEAPDLAGPGTLVFTGGEDHPDTLKTLTELGFRQPETISSIVRTWHHGRYRALRSTRAKELLTELVPAILGTFGKTLDPDAALLRFNDFLGGLPAGVQLLSLFYTNPALLELLAEIMGSTPRLAESLRQHPILFDAVLTSDFFDAAHNAAELSVEFDRALEQAQDFQDVLSILCRHVNDRLFQVGVHILQGRTTPDDAGPALSDIADTALSTLYPRQVSEFAHQHGCFPGGDMATLALGKLGGREVTIGSDLDLMFIYRCDDSASDGPKPLAPIAYFTRLGQRFVGSVTAPTGEGVLYEVDLRLRPSGTAGPLATSLESFVKYHEEAAWTWERMALTRARVVVAGEALRTELENAIRKALTAPRDREALLRDVADMRARIERDRVTAGPWDVKNMRGGLVDIEFLAQYLQLHHAMERPEVLSPNTTEALRRLCKAGVIPESTTATLTEAMRLWRNVQGVLRLSVGESFDEATVSDGCRAFVANVCGRENFTILREEIADTAASCHAIFRAMIEEPARDLPPASPPAQ